VYGVVTFLTALFGFFSSAGLVYVTLRASLLIHNLTLRTVLNGTMQFFWSTPLGRILNRLSRDVDQLDFMLPMALDQFTGLSNAKKKRTLCIVFIIGLRIVFASDRHFCCCCYCLPCGNFDVSVSGARVRVARGLFASRNASISSPWRCLEIFCCVRVGHNDFGIVDNPSDGRL
jgi:ABC-type multidrug transport system fused ATPase/permease subunit